MLRYRIDPDRSTVVVEARSSVGPIAWEGVGPSGEFAVAGIDGEIHPGSDPGGWMELRLDQLTSGNRLYDAELLRRVDASQHPVARVELQDVTTGDTDGWYHATGELRFHGVTRRISGDIEVEVREDHTVLVTGDQQIDIRDFGLPAPTMLMLKVYPDVHVHMVVQGEPVD